ncbi:hypothetical protein [Nisaea nitritireducens]|uniref:hypothetical protein n=1 Tax=Nisaea nitritireducens TaxID=568392 RepID=UPI0018691C6D|nr:hypothetical protein [Nisaea nitritireducens]
MSVCEVSAILEFFNFIQGFVFSKEFQISLWSAIFSSVIVSVFIALIVNYYTNFFKSPDITMLVKQGDEYSDKLMFVEAPNGKYEATFKFSIRNKGTQVLKPEEGYWHIYLPSGWRINVDEEKGVPSYIDPGAPNHLRELIRLPVYPNSFTDLGEYFTFSIEKVHFNSPEIHFFFETNYGFFPDRIKRDRKTGLIKFDDFGKIKISVR